MKRIAFVTRREIRIDMHRWIVPAILWMILSLSTTVVQGQGPARLDDGEIPRAPQQRKPPSYIPASPGLFNVDDVLSGRTARQQRLQVGEQGLSMHERVQGEVLADERSLPREESPELQLIQYPLDSSGSDDLVKEIESNERTALSSLVSVGFYRPDEPVIASKDYSVTTTVLPSFGDDFGITSIDLRATVFSPKVPAIRLTPRFSSHFLTGPSTTDMPGQVFDLGVDIGLFVPINDRLTLLTGIAPSMYSDFENTSGDAFRITGQAMAFYKWSEKLSIVAGVIYLDREDIGFLPGAGLVYTPSDSLRFDILFPKPKVAFRYQHDETFERWWYLAGELGGGSWAIRRSTGAEDIATYSDYKMLVGMEHKQTDSYRWFVEGGYVFGRDLDYLRDPSGSELPGTGVIRTGVVW